jgi:SAM-dependent methyltransferase
LGGQPFELTGAVGENENDDLAIRNAYATHLDGADGYYREFGHQYRNPHENGVVAMVARIPAMFPEFDLAEAAVLDLACGSGEVTLALLHPKLGVTPTRVTACDPYTAEAFARRTQTHHSTKPGLVAESWSFSDIANGVLGERRFDLIVCAYALHLCEASWLPAVCMALSVASDRLVIITPHKRPEIEPWWGWSLREEYRDPAYRIRLRAYQVTKP